MTSPNAFPTPPQKTQTSERPLLFMSVDLDSWIHCRWASGGPNSFWPDSRLAFRAVYGQDAPGREFHRNCEWVLETFARYGITATFFVLGEIGQLCPQLVRQVREAGHEIASHGMYHVDNSRYTLDEFRESVRCSRQILEDVVGEEVVGYRAPNLVLDSEQLTVLADEGFLYDSSVCPTRKFFGKFGNMTGAPRVPYRPARHNLTARGDLNIVELPHGAFPVLNLPASTGVMTRMLGRWWSEIAIARSLRQGYGLYYFHPYEIGPSFDPPVNTRYVRLFLRNVGASYRSTLCRLIEALQTKADFVPGRRLVEQFGNSA